MIVGNGYLNKYLGTALGHVFSGNYRIGDTTTATFDVLTGNWKANMEYGKEHGWGLLNALANVGLQAAGGLSAIYALGNGDVGLKLSADNVKDGVLDF